MRAPRDATEAPRRAPHEHSAPPRFRFACQRSGRCCTHGDGYVWVDAREIAALAAELGVTVEGFSARFVKDVVDPTNGAARQSLREQAGRCVLLEGANECSAYAARPAQCRTFPRWASVLAGGTAFERARETCPGIAVVVDARTVARGGRALTQWCAERAPVEPQEPCPFGDATSDGGAGCAVHATGLEIDVALARGASPRRDSEHPERCPFWAAGACSAGTARPLACRSTFRDGERGEQLWRELRALEDELGYPAASASISALVASRLAEEVRA